MRRTVDQAVRELFMAKALPERRFAALCRVAAQYGEPPRARSRFVRVPYWGTVAAGVVVVIALAALQYRGVPPFSADAHQRIADEVATNHVKLKPLEVSSGDMSEVRTFFDPLGFALIESAMLDNTPWRIVGGRFCTIRGEAAAQLRMRGLDGAVQTVYQVPYDRAVHRELPDVLRDESPLTLYSHGLRIHLWRERGLLFATVSEEHAPGKP